MSEYKDGQPDGPESESWQTTPSDTPQPHGYFEPSKYRLLDAEGERRRKHWHRLLADNVAPHDVWWVRLMRHLKGR